MMLPAGLDLHLYDIYRLNIILMISLDFFSYRYLRHFD